MVGRWFKGAKWGKRNEEERGRRETQKKRKRDVSSDPSMSSIFNVSDF